MNSHLRALYLFTIVCLSILCWSNLWASDTSLRYQISGIEGAAQKNAIKRLEQEQKNISEPLSEIEINTLYQNAPQIIQEALKPYGYFAATITEPSLQQIDSSHWQATFLVIPGKQLKITQLEVNVSGEGAEDFKKILKTLPLKKGHGFLNEDYTKTKDILTDHAAEKGYLNARFTKHAVYIDVKKQSVNIILDFATGPQYYFGKVTFVQDTFAESFLDKFVHFEPGDEYHSDALMQLQQDLQSTVYFKKVSVQPQSVETVDLKIPVDIFLEPSKSQQYDFGLGFGTDTGPRGTMGVNLRHLTDTGQYFSSFLRLSQVQSSLQARYVIPGKNPITDQYFLAASIENQAINSSRGNTQKLTFGQIGQYAGWQRTLSLNYQWDHYSIRNMPYERTHLLLPTINFLKSKTDNILFPRQGYRMNVHARGASSSLLSNSSFLQLELDTRFVFSPNQNNRFLLRADAGYTLADEIDKVPLSLQFFAGGAQSIRGYRYQELGPGRYLFVGSVEYQHLLRDKLFGAVFIDGGNAVNSLSNPKGKALGRPRSSVDLSDLMKYSVGFGVVWVSPVGPIELTLAKPITDSSKHPHIQFTMGANL